MDLALVGADWLLSEDGNMKKLMFLIATLMAFQAHAQQTQVFTKTTVRCVAKADPAMIFSRSVRDASMFQMLDYTFWPQLAGQDKVLLVKKTQDKGDWQRFVLGASEASIEIAMNDGDIYSCNIKMEKYKDVAPISVAPGS